MSKTMQPLSSDILIVDDKPDNLELLISLLQKQGYRVRPAINGDMALIAARNTPPQLVLLDINMPGKNGYEVCELLKQDPLTADIPVIFLSAMDETLDKVRAFSVGGVDYITKPFQLEEIIARIQTHLALFYQRRLLEQQQQEILELREKERQHYQEMSQIKDQVLRTVSHDLKNPLSVILTYASLIETLAGKNNEKLKSYVDKIVYNAHRMSQLITELLDTSRIESEEGISLESVLLHPFLQEALESFTLMAENKEINLSYLSPGPDVRLLLNRTRMRQAIDNLLSNAIKYTPEGGEVRLEVQRHSDHISIIVADTGWGIPPEDVPKIFDKFFRVRRQEHLEETGNGLGLAIVKAVVELHGGTIQVDSTLSVGTTFRLRLPLHRTAFSNSA